MKLKIFITCICTILITSCGTLDLNPLSDGSSETWNSTAEEIEMSLNGLYKDAFWMVDSEEWADDYIYRDALSPITGSSLNGQTDFVKTWWTNTYKAIARANIVISSVDRAAAVLSKAQIDRYAAEARFVRACQYSRLLSHYGNIIYTEKDLDIEEALTLKQEDKTTVLPKIYADFDFAAGTLKTTYGNSELKRASAGAAYAMKARIALQMGDWATAKTAAKACMDLKLYNLHSNFDNLFISKTKNSVETIFGLPRSIALKVVQGDTQNYVTRNAGGFAAKDPSWDLLCSFLCTDGLPIDKSPLYNPRRPFLNRDPRCKATIVEFQTSFLGYTYQPHPDSLTVFKVADNKYVENKDTRSVAQFASFNGLVLKKGVDSDWLLNSWSVEPDKILIRYADVLLMYAEAKIELNEIDQTVLDAINTVRARAYGVALSATTYPAVKTQVQSELRKAVRIERRMEFAFEGIRYMDIIRWKLAEKVLNKINYGLLDPADLRTKVVKPGLWFFPSTPVIDEDGSADFTPMFTAGLIKQIAVRKFDATRQYLWPIPTTEILTSGLKQNPNY
ncbi:RagB/SusD family nutrient uptake outer membrane protein [Dyadobacter psychrotolerans]|uniref:RagB/SusD family nutrient uptake outer membrane protein n=1 Tax=Dyadobacter psychrotolerans TaxID=2541721 RepID=A0A4V2Z3N7_9BACT|nr:RagB/SusD family nutrient uptake outer membrane protein [Dyadobacter psychrotolerans]TDE13358.1 RagB/SusD family nutrient uptake outer membrane protein [Dyadobacter psychrotolerans]